MYFGEGATKKVKRERITITSANQVLDFVVEKKPDFINFDAEKQLLAVINEEKTIKDFVYQYKNAPLYLDRNDALESFSSNLDEPGVYETVVTALNDKWYGHRLKAISLLTDIASKKEKELKPLFIKIVNEDPKTMVKAEAIDFLAKNYTGTDLDALYQSKLSDSSYVVMGSALIALAKSNPDATLKQAKQFETETATSIRYALMNLYLKYGTDEQNAYFAKIKDDFSGFERFGFMNLYSAYLKRCSDEIVLSGMEYFSETAKKESNSYVKTYAQRAIKAQVSRYDQKESELSGQIEEAKKTSSNTADLQAKLDKTTATKNKLKEMLEAAK